MPTKTKLKKRKLSPVEREAPSGSSERGMWATARMRSERALHLVQRFYDYMQGEPGIGSPADVYELEREARELLILISGGMTLRLQRIQEKKS